MSQKLIERDFPVEGLNDIARREATGHDAKLMYFRLHKWWAPRPGNVFRAIILLSLQDELPPGKSLFAPLAGDRLDWDSFWGTPEDPGYFYQNHQERFKNVVILDPFMGGGTTLIEGLRLGCKVVGLDLNAVAWFATRSKLLLPTLTRKQIDDEFERIQKDVGSRIRSYYQTICPHCLAETKDPTQSLVDILYIFWVKIATCRNGHRVPLFPYWGLAKQYAAAGKQDILVCPECWAIFPASTGRERRLACPQGHVFDPNQGNSQGQRYHCPVCDATEKTVDAIKRLGRLPVEMVAVEYLCPRHGRGIKAQGERDRELYQQAETEWNQVKDNYLGRLVPDQPIPPGDKTKDLHRHGYTYWREMFNPRQLLCLSWLVESILETQDSDVQDVLMAAFSDMLQSHSMLSRYNLTAHELEGLFSMHAMWPPDMPVENNIWGAEVERQEKDAERRGRMTFLRQREKIGKAWRYIAKPNDKYPESGAATPTKKTIDVGDHPREVSFAREYADLRAGDNILLQIGNAEFLACIPGEEQVDAVITDPPYYGNVQYSELSDFFYVWLHKALGSKYPRGFGTPLMTLRSAREIVVNKQAGKGADFYIASLTNAFSEAGRVLKDDGLLVFTFHHKHKDSWGAVLKALLEGGLLVVATYPIHAEKVGSKHSLKGKERIEMQTIDRVVVARKREGQPLRVLWDDLKRDLYFAAERAVRQIKESHPSLPEGDKATIVLGELLEIYSQHYPEVYRGDQPVDVDEAIQEGFAIAEEFILGKKLPEMDNPSAVYVSVLMGMGKISLDNLMQLMLPRGLGIDDLKRLGMVESLGTFFLVRGPLIRGKELFEGQRPFRYLVDAAHYLYYAYTEDRPIDWHGLAHFDGAKLLRLMGYLADQTKDSTYDSIQDLVSRNLADKPRQSQAVQLPMFDKEV